VLRAVAGDRDLHDVGVVLRGFRHLEGLPWFGRSWVDVRSGSGWGCRKGRRRVDA
jgi:hypothetical protein